MTKKTFHHTCILAGSRELATTCENFYRDNFGMGLTFSGVTESSDFLFYADNVNPALSPFEIIGKTIEEREDTFLAKYGPGLDHICFMVDDLRKVYEDLSADGVQFHVPPYEFQGSVIAWCKDPSGVEVELMQTNVYIPVVEVESQAPKAQYNHVSILAGTRELAQMTEDFYAKHFGMKEVLRGGPSKEMDWVYLEDASGKNPLWIEIVGSALYDSERAFIEKNGPGMEHHCFVVEDAGHYCQWLKDKGVTLESDLIDFSGARMFYLRDPANVLIQVLQMPAGV